MISQQQLSILRTCIYSGETLVAASAQAGISRKTARTYLTMTKADSPPPVRPTWRIPDDPFSPVWTEIVSLLEKRPRLTAETLVEELQGQYPDRFHNAQLPILQVKLHTWRATTEMPKYGSRKPRVPRATKLDPYKPYLAKRLKSGGWNVPALLEDLQALGYQGGATMLSAYLRPFRQVTAPRALQGTAKDSLWMLRLLQGDIPTEDLQAQLRERLDASIVERLQQDVLIKPLRFRNRALTILAHSHSIATRAIAKFLFLKPITVRGYIRRFKDTRIESLYDIRRKAIRKADDPRYKDAVFALLHSPPASHDINRTTWRLADLHRILAEQGLPLAPGGIRTIIRAAGYRFRKARKVLTSTDPAYQEKLEEITRILAQLGPKEKFFSIDEFGPFAVKMQGGTSLVPQGQTKTVPQRQVTKGSMILTGALELSTNQVTHFYSEAKNTEEMIKLLHLLMERYAEEDSIYFSWDAASWHASAKLYAEVERLNNPEYRETHKGPLVKFTPLPASAQFLNVIESVFSGMSRAIIQNSDYPDVAAVKAAIDRYFAERNAYFQANPRRAGNKIWGKERVEATFSASNNCKDPHY